MRRKILRHALVALAVVFASWALLTMAVAQPKQVALPTPQTAETASVARIQVSGPSYTYSASDEASGPEILDASDFISWHYGGEGVLDEVE